MQNMLSNVENPFIRVTWEDSPENFTSEKIRRVKTYFQNKYNTTNVKIVTKTTNLLNNTKLQSLEVSDNILDTEYQKTLMKDFIKENNMIVDWNLLNRLDDKVNAEIDSIQQNKVRYNKWHINKIEFSNFLSYGEDNVLEFSKLNGISVIESSPANFAGKTSISADLLSFLFFNTTTKSKTNGEIFNLYSDKDEVFVRGEITIDNNEYVIERTLTRKKSRNGEYKVSTNLEFYQILNGETLNLSGEQRKETEKFIENAIGTYDDFLTTILTTSNNLESLIESKPTERGMILTKFLGLENLKIKEDVTKKMYDTWSKTLVSNIKNKVSLQNGIEEMLMNIQTENNNITNFEYEKINLTNKLNKLTSDRESLLLKRNNNIDQSLINFNPIHLERENNQLIVEMEKSIALSNNIVIKEPSQYYNQDKHKELQKLINEKNYVFISTRNDINKLSNEINNLKSQTVCPVCKQDIKDIDNTQIINNLTLELLSKQKYFEELLTEVKKLEETNSQFTLLENEFNLYEKNKLIKTKYELDVEIKRTAIEKNKFKLEQFESNKYKLEENKQIDSNLVILKTQIETVNADINRTSINIEKAKNSIVYLEKTIEDNKQYISKIESEEKGQVIFKAYLTIYGKNGLNKVIMRNMIPLINQELFRLLKDSCYFILELNINDKNEIEFLMIDTETRLVKNLITGSGYEKTISSLALRSVLTKVSTLPKPNIIVMDEVFGKIADENLEMVGEFFRKIRNYFDNIIVISHNPLIRNWSDNVILVKKENNISKIENIIINI